jgi:hypothetical protein
MKKKKKTTMGEERRKAGKLLLGAILRMSYCYHCIGDYRSTTSENHGYSLSDSYWHVPTPLSFFYTDRRSAPAPAQVTCDFTYPMHIDKYVYTLSFSVAQRVLPSG